MTRTNQIRRLLGWTLGIASAAMVLGSPAVAAPGGQPDTPTVSKPQPAPPPDAVDPKAGPRVVDKPKLAPEAQVQPQAWSVTVTASPDRPWPRQYSTITATANQDVGPTPYYLSIFQVGWEDGVWRERLVASCGSGTTCSASVVQNTPTDRGYRAYVARYPSTFPPPEIQAEAPRFSYLWVTWHSTGIGLAANQNTTGIGGAVTVTATTGDDVGPSPFYITIFDETTRTRVAVCGSGRSCSATVSQSAATTHRFASFVSDNSEAFPPTGSISASAPTFVTWADGGFQVSLSAPERVVNTYQITVTATVNRDIGPTPYFVRIFNIATGQLVGSCASGTTCSVTADIGRGWNSHVAFLSSFTDTTMPPANAVGSSNSAHTENIYIG